MTQKHYGGTLWRDASKHSTFTEAYRFHGNNKSPWNPCYLNPYTEVIGEPDFKIQAQSDGCADVHGDVHDIRFNDKIHPTVRHMLDLQVLFTPA